MTNTYADKAREIATMDTDKIARQITAQICGEPCAIKTARDCDCFRNIRNGLEEIARQAHLQGREEAAKVCERRMFELSGPEYGMADAGERKYQREFNAVLKATAQAIRSIPEKG
jgi:hypothetical protein